MEQWVKSVPEETQAAQMEKREKKIFRAPTQGGGKREEDQVSPLLVVQLIFCVAVLLFVLLTRSINTAPIPARTKDYYIIVYSPVFCKKTFVPHQRSFAPAMDGLQKRS